MNHLRFAYPGLLLALATFAGCADDAPATVGDAAVDRLPVDVSPLDDVTESDAAVDLGGDAAVDGGDDTPSADVGDASMGDAQDPDVDTDVPAVDTPVATDTPVTMDAPAPDAITPPDAPAPDVITPPDAPAPDVITPRDVPAMDLPRVDAPAPDVITPPDAPRTDTPATDTPVVDAGACPIAMRSCYSGAAGTAGTGTCRNGVQLCVNGVFGPCTGEVTPTAEACNGADDNCNGMTDEGLGTISCGVGACAATGAACAMGRPGTCTPGASRTEVCADSVDNNCNGLVDEGCGCTHVSTTGNDMTGAGTASAPFRTIATGIARAGSAGLPSVVCVAGGTYAENVTMRNGVSVYGGYMQTGTTWPRTGAASIVNPSMDRGTYFDRSINRATVLDGFTLNAANLASNAAVTIEGSTMVTVSNNIVTGNGGQNSVGVWVRDASGTAASATLRANAIVGGTGATTAIGVRVQRSGATIVGSCATFDTAGRCTAACNATRSIRGRTGTTAGAEAYAVRLEDARNVTIDTSGLCSGPGATDVAGVRVTGAATGTVIRANAISAFGGSRNSVGVWVEDCGDASPWVVNNANIVGSSPTLGARADGVRSVGRCHAVVDSNVRIVGGVESANNDANGVLCAANGAGVPSRCTVLNNTTIQGAGGGYPPNATGVHCENGSCVRIEGNETITGQSAQHAYGVVLINTGAFVARNGIYAGCGSVEAEGIHSDNSFARVEDNLIFGLRCNTAPGGATGASWGVRVVLGTGSNEIDLHSNDIFAEGIRGVGTTRGVSFEVPSTGAPMGARGLVRNNVVSPGIGAVRIALAELSHDADPRVVINNDLWFTSAGDVVYRNEGGTNLTTAAQVNGLTDITSAANLIGDPRFVGAPNYRLMATSPCVNAGTATAAPVVDFYGTRRPNGSAPDIGAAEF